MTYQDIKQKYRLGVELFLPVNYHQDEVPTSATNGQIWSTGSETFLYENGWKDITIFVTPDLETPADPNGLSPLSYVGKVDLHKYKPFPYVGVLEYEELMEIESRLFGSSALGLEVMLKNNSLSTLTSDGIREYEKVLGIIPNPAEEPDSFRRERIINRLSLRPPFTMKFMFQRFDELIGKGRWEAYFDRDTFTLIVETPPSNELWANELLITVNSVKPANVLFVTKPALRTALLVNETYNYFQNIYQYRLNGTWKLGEKPFVLYDDKGVVKMATTPSLQDTFFEDVMANNTIISLRFNETLVKPATIEIDSDNNQIIVEAEVLQGELDIVTKVEMLNGSSQVLSSSDVYMVVQEGLTFKNTIRFREGVS